MDVFECIKTRRSIRKYLQKPVEFDKLTLILEAASKAPSSGNLQDYRFIVVTDKEAINGIAKHCTEQYWISQAPLLIVVCADFEKNKAYYGLRGERLYAVQNAAAATQNLLLAAHGLGLSSCWVGSFDEGYVSDTLGVPENVRPQAILTLGYADEEPREREEEPIETFVYFNSYGNKIENLNMLLREYNKEIEKILKKAEPKVEGAAAKIKGHAKSLFEKAKKSVERKK